MEAFRAVVGAQVHVAHRAHLVDVGEYVLCLGADYDVGLHSLLVEPLHLRVDGRGAHASGHEEDPLLPQLLRREVHEVGRASERAGEVGEAVALLHVAYLLGRDADGLGNDGYCARLAVVVADRERNALTLLVGADDDELARLSRSGHERGVDLHLGDVRGQASFAYDFEHDMSDLKLNGVLVRTGCRGACQTESFFCRVPCHIRLYGTKLSLICQSAKFFRPCSPRKKTAGLPFPPFGGTLPPHENPENEGAEEKHGVKFGGTGKHS